MESPLVQLNQEILEKKPYSLEGKALEQYIRIIERLYSAQTQRWYRRDEFDGLTYDQVYLANQRAGYSYLAPKINLSDVRVNTGTTEKKVEFILNELLALNLQSEILAYDKDDQLIDNFSYTCTDLVHRTEEMEHADEKDLFILQELLTQPGVYVEENWVERTVGTGKKKKTIRRCERQLLQGSQIYLGDITLPGYRFQEQPYIFKYFRKTYAEARTLFGDMECWEYIKPGAYSTIQPVPYQIYRMGSLLSNEVEGFIYMCPNDKEYQIILQGIPLYGPGEPLPWDWEGYNIVFDGIKPFHGDFSYYKSLVQAAKTLQALDNETIRNLIRKFQQSVEPPTGVPNGKVWSRDIWSAGSMVQGVTKDMFSKLIDHDGITPSEYQMFELIENKVDEFIGRPQVTSDSGGNPTATQILTEQREAAKMIGLAVLAAMRIKSKLGIMRAKNIFSNYGKPIGKSVDPITKKIRETYATFTIQNASLGDINGTKIVQFSDQSPNQDQLNSLFSQEEKMAKSGKPTRYEILDVTKVNNIDWYFYAKAVPKPTDSQELEKMMYQDELNQAAMISRMTGRMINADKTIEKFERLWGSKDVFEKQPASSPIPPQELQSYPSKVKSSITQPGLNALLNVPT